MCQDIHRFQGNKIKDSSRIFKDSNEFFSKTHSTSVFSTLHSFYGIKSDGNTDFHYILYCSPMTAPFFHTMGITDHSAMTTLSRTNYGKFQNFQAPTPFTSTFWELQKWKIFQELSSTSGNPNVCVCNCETVKVCRTALHSLARAHHVELFVITLIPGCWSRFRTGQMQ